MREMVSRTRRVARAFALVILVAVGLVALLVGSAAALLRTNWGGALAKETILRRVNSQLQGTLAIERLRVRPDGVELSGVLLADPTGAPVIRVRRMDVRLRLRSLFHRRVEIRAFAVEEPWAHIQMDKGGSNLTRALAPRQPPPATAQQSGGGWQLTLHRLTVTGGTFELGRPDLRLRVTTLAAEGEASYDPGSNRAHARLHLTLGPTGMVKATLDAAGDGITASIDASIDADIGETTVRAGGSVRGRTLDLQGRLEARDLHETAHVLRRVLDLDPPPLTGGGVVTFAITGTIDAPRVAARAQVPSLQIGNSAVRGADIAFTLGQ